MDRSVRFWRAWSSSVLNGAISNGNEDTEILASSVIVNTVNRVLPLFAETLEKSRLVDTVDKLLQLTRSSFVYGWLTQKPDSDVVVIDINDSLFASPLVTLVDAGVDVANKYRGSSMVFRTMKNQVIDAEGRLLTTLGTLLVAASASFVGFSLLLGSLPLSSLLLASGVGIFGILAIRVDKNKTTEERFRNGGDLLAEVVVSLLEPPDVPDQRTGETGVDGDSTTRPTAGENRSS